METDGALATELTTGASLDAEQGPGRLTGRSARRPPHGVYCLRSTPSGEVNEVSSSKVGTSVSKAFALLDAFGPAETVGVSELARRVDIAKPTAFRLLKVLCERKIVERDGTKYRLGMKLFELGNQVTFCSPGQLRDIAHPYLEELRALTGETVHLAVLVGADVVYLDKLIGRGFVRSPSRIGGRIEASCTAVGKAMLAFSPPTDMRCALQVPLKSRTPYSVRTAQRLLKDLAAVRQVGVAFDREEARLGLVCVGAPVLDGNGFALGALSISGASGRFRPDPHIARLQRAASAVGRAVAEVANGYSA